MSRHPDRPAVGLISLGVCFAAAVPAPGSAATVLDLSANLNTMGVIVTLDTGADPDGDATAALSYRTGTAAFAAAFGLTRTRDTQLVGSLFGLQPGTTYDVRVTLTDPDGGPLDGLVLTSSGTTRGEITVPEALASHHVSPAGTGTACSETVPCSLAQGIAQAGIGDEVVLGGGVYFVGEISIPRSGAAGAPIVLRAADGESPVLDGSDPQDFTWLHEGGGVYVTTVNAPDTHLVAVDDERLYPYQTLADLQALSWGLPGFQADGTTVRVHLEDGADPNGREVRVSRFNSALELDFVDHVYLIGLTFRHYGRGEYAKAVYLNGSSDCLVRSCTFELCDLGIGLKRAADRTVIEDSEFSDTVFGWVWESIKAGAGLETGGIRVYDSDPSPRGTVIRRNHFHDFFDGFGVCPDSDTGTTVETDVHDNLVERVGDDGFETDGYCSNLRIWGNEIRDCLVGISLAPVYRGPVFALRNLIHRTGAGTSQAGYTGSCFKLNSGYGQSGTMFLIHNTCDAFNPGNDAFAIKSPGTWDLVWSRNNIWSGTAYAIDNANPSQPLDLDWDALHTSLPDELVWWDSLADRHLRTLSELQAATGHELNGRSGAPGFSDPVTGDYAPSPDSALIDAGLHIPGLNDGFAGSAPDLGAFEEESLVFTDGFESGALEAWSSHVP